MTATLYEISLDRKALLDLAMEAGEVTPELDALLNAGDEKLKTKVEAVVRYLRNQQALVTARRAEASRLEDDAAVVQRGIDGLTRWLGQCLELAGNPKVETVIGTVYRQRNGQPVVKWAGSPETIPDAFRIDETVVTHKLDRAKAIAAHKAAQLPAGLTVEYGFHVRGLTPAGGEK